MLRNSRARPRIVAYCVVEGIDAWYGVYLNITRITKPFYTIGNISLGETVTDTYAFRVSRASQQCPRPPTIVLFG